jgi:hypothetical protein
LWVGKLFFFKTIFSLLFFLCNSKNDFYNLRKLCNSILNHSKWIIDDEDLKKCSVIGSWSVMSSFTLKIPLDGRWKKFYPKVVVCSAPCLNELEVPHALTISIHNIFLHILLTLTSPAAHFTLKKSARPKNFSKHQP